MEIVLKSVSRLIFILGLLVHFGLILFFFSPSWLLFGIAYPQASLIEAESIPSTISESISVDHLEMFEYTTQASPSFFQKLSESLLSLRQKRFMDASAQLAFRLSLLDFGGEVVGLASASHYYYDKPLERLSDEEWGMLIQLHAMFSDK